MNPFPLIKNAALVLSSAAVLSALGFLTYRQMSITRTRKSLRIPSKNGIDEDMQLNIGGIEQYISIRGQNTENPIILFLHGGPGGSMSSFTYTYQSPLEEHYTVVNWDQRNAGKTYLLNQKLASEIQANLTPDVLVEDIHEIAIYLTSRFKKSRIIIMGHSWGTVIGSSYVFKHPELVQAYVGVGQAICLPDQILNMAEYTRSLATAQGDETNVKILDTVMEELRSIVSFEKCMGPLMEINQIAQKYIPVDTDTNVFTKPMLFSPNFSLGEFLYYFKMDTLQRPLVDYLSTYDLREVGDQYEVPIVYIFGERDWQMKLLAKEYFNQIQAPFKKYLEVPDAGHLPFMNQPALFARELRRALEEIPLKF